MQRLEADWPNQIGKRRFTELKATLEELTEWTTYGKLAARRRPWGG